ncbi:hypothetical protein [Leptospira sp. GIMC2001]|uniref:hypothetical protein n=1 Tax=Leptospira sp. GIMC2001 TaxID=1513297 RepID=UPI00234BF747|nr:hypothetical protein [Leptospira sp. GIMC2001]WCL48184.1 hypothetical protein O4O04_12790 [Leptospira sp. GIMC2001]
MFFRSFIVIFSVLLLNFQWADWTVFSAFEDYQDEISMEEVEISIFQFIPLKKTTDYFCKLEQFSVTERSFYYIKIIRQNSYELISFFLNEYNLLNLPPPIQIT